MLALSLTLALLAPPQGPSAAVVINELSYDDSGTDDREFVELFNCSGAAVDIGGWMVEAADSAVPDNNPDYAIPAGTVLQPGAYWVLGAATVPGVSQVVGSTNLWENDNESITLRDASGRVVDAVVYEANKGVWAGVPIEGDGLWGNHQSIDGIETSWSRVRDGVDSGSNGLDFVLAPSTPGAANDLATGAYAETFDALPVGSTPAEWIGSLVDLHVVDPTVVDAFNPSAIAASPQGGNCAVCWDPAGGGDTAVLLREVAGPAVFEAYVHVDAPVLTSSLESLHWSVGFGTTDSFSNSPDPSGTLGAGFEANGNVGVSWTFQNLPAGAALYLIDHNDGGWSSGSPRTPQTVFGSVAIAPGSNDGWQRLYLERNGSSVIGVFGGTYGSGTTTGTVITGSVAWTGPTTLYVGYRENDGITGIPPWVRPLTFDRISVAASPASAAVASFGVAAATTFGTPTMAAAGLPALGNTAFRIDLSGLVPSQVATVFVGASGPTIDLGAVGGQPGSFLYVGSPYVCFPVAVDAGGNAALSYAICDPDLLGFLLSWQVLDLDLNLPFVLPFGTSRRLDTTLGY